MMLAGAAAGALMLAGPALLKIRFGVDEVVTTLLLGFIALLFVSMMLDGPMKDPLAMGWPQSAALDPATRAVAADGALRCIAVSSLPACWRSRCGS